MSVSLNPSSPRSRALSLRAVAGLCAVLAVTAGASWLLFGQPPATAEAGPAPAHAVWNRHPSLGELMRASTAVVTASVATVTDAPPITPAQANAPLDTPPLPRKQVTMETTDRLHGDDPGARFELLHVLPPKGSVLQEDPQYNPREQYLLFLRPGDLPGTWQVVGLDGRLPVESSGEFKGLLPNGPSDEINRGRADLRRILQEAKQR
jgi:hypothetical protein